MESEEMALMNLFSGQQRRNRHREQTYGQGGRRGGKRGDVLHNSMCKTGSQWEFVV